MKTDMTSTEFRQFVRRTRGKYGNRKVQLDGHTFDSKAEAKRYQELRLMERAGEISDLELQPEFKLLPSFTDSSGRRHRGVKYVADFAYTDSNGQRTVEDVKGGTRGKGTSTAAFRIKWKWAIRKYPNLCFVIHETGG